MFPVEHKRKERGRSHAKTIDRCRIAVRLEARNLGLTDAEIAMHIGLKPARYVMLKRTTIYRTLKTQYMTGILSDLDADIENNFETNRKTLEKGVPVALENLLAAAAQKTDLNIQLRASIELLDRHGRYAKVSRIGAPTEEQGRAANEEDDKIANELIAATGGGVKEKQIDIESPTPKQVM